jgi:hypothetical protein
MTLHLPTKKFFITLIVFVVAGAGIFKMAMFLKQQSNEKYLEEQKLTAVQNEARARAANLFGDTVTAPETLNAVAKVIYLNEQTKANGATMEQITASVGQKIQKAKEALDKDVYSKKDVIVSKDNSTESLKNYGNAMMEIFIKHGSNKSGESFVVLAKKAFETKNPEDFKKLDVYLDYYSNIIKDSLALPVPSSAVPVHLSMVNSYHESKLLIQGFRNGLDDINPAIASFSRLGESSVGFLDAFKDAADFFKEKEVVFSSEDKGALFDGITQRHTKQ